MIELIQDELVFSFPELHPEAKLKVSFQRTLRIPDDGKTYPLPPGLGTFPIKHVDDFAKNVPTQWIQHGGVMFPMYQSEALWIKFSSTYLNAHQTRYPFAIKIATGKINTITGEEWKNELNVTPQDYLVVPGQPWLDGYCVKEGLIRQFVALPLGTGYSAEEQLTGKAELGGLQIIAYPMKEATFFEKFPEIQSDILFQSALSTGDMGLSPGGKMKQEIYEDPYGINNWELSSSSRCFVHLTNSLVWRSITGEAPPTTPFTSKEYEKTGLPWYDYYDDELSPVEGAVTLNSMKSVTVLGSEKADIPLPENESVKIKTTVTLTKNQVRDGEF